MSLSDTSPEMEAIQLAIYRSQTPAQKWLILDGAYRALRLLHAAGVYQRSAGATPRTVLEDWIHRVLNCPHVVVPEHAVMDAPSIPGIADLRIVTRVLERLGIRYALGGSMASSVHGIPRTTQDADLSIEEFGGKEQHFVDALGSAYYVSLDAIKDAHQRHTSFNIIHSISGFKVDFFIIPRGGLHESALARGRPTSFLDKPEEPIIVCTPEDVILLKLHWYRLGNEVSEHQWQDVLGVYKTQGALLDHTYLEQWAGPLGVADLLPRARQESGL